MIIMGIDPGTARLGFSIIKKNKKGSKNKFNVLDYGCIETPSNLSPGDRLKKINNELNKLIKRYNPQNMAVENIYFFKNTKTALSISQVKGVVLLIAAQKKIPVYEFTPLQMKMTITGYGRADKKQIQKMIQIILKLKKFPKQDDAADALGIAVCGGLKIDYYDNQKTNKN